MNLNLTRKEIAWRKLTKLALFAAILWMALQYLKKDSHIKQQTDERPQEVVLFTVVCDGGHNSSPSPENPKADDWTLGLDKDGIRQVEQARVLFKSAVALTHARLRFILLTDSVELYDQLVGTTADWPSEYQDKVTFQYQPVWYPPGRDHLRPAFRPCSSERLFTTALIPTEDAVIYIDSDIIFMSPPEEFWAEFKKFNSKQVAGMGESIVHYGTNPKSRTPFYGPTGLNAGVILMNVTRMKTFPGGGWDAACMRAWDENEELLVYHDQDVLNVIFKEHPSLHYDLGCEWNYQIWSCDKGRNFCPSTGTEGARIVHGNALTFVTNYEWKLRALFESWKDYEMGTPLMDLYKTIRKNLLQVKEQRKPSGCARLREIDVALSEQLLRNINKNETRTTT